MKRKLLRICVNEHGELAHLQRVGIRENETAAGVEATFPEDALIVDEKHFDLFDGWVQFDHMKVTATWKYDFKTKQLVKRHLDTYIVEHPGAVQADLDDETLPIDLITSDPINNKGLDSTDIKTQLEDIEKSVNRGQLPFDANRGAKLIDRTLVEPKKAGSAKIGAIIP